LGVWSGGEVIVFYASIRKEWYPVEYEDYLEGDVNNFVPSNIFKKLKL